MKQPQIKSRFRTESETKPQTQHQPENTSTRTSSAAVLARSHSSSPASRGHAPAAPWVFRSAPHPQQDQPFRRQAESTLPHNSRLPELPRTGSCGLGQGIAGNPLIFSRIKRIGTADDNLIHGHPSAAIKTVNR
jgi:hypothetical protein